MTGDRQTHRQLPATEEEDNSALVDMVTNSLAILIVLVTMVLIVTALADELTGSILKREDVPRLNNTRAFAHFRPITVNFRIDEKGLHRIDLTRFLDERNALPAAEQVLPFEGKNIKVTAWESEVWDLNTFRLTIANPAPATVMVPVATWEDGVEAMELALSDLEPGLAPFIFVHPGAVGRFGDLFEKLTKAKIRFRWQIGERLIFVRSFKAFQYNDFFL